MRILIISIVILSSYSCTQKELNLLIIHTDQQSQWSVSAYGLDELRGPLNTPHLDALAEEGILFTNFFTNSAVCSPSRALMMTGCYATRNGVYSNNMIMRDIPTLASQLADAGYSTGYAGKWHLSGEARPGWAPDSYGWADNRFMFNRGHYKKLSESEDGSLITHPYKIIGDEDSYTTDWLTDKAIEFLRENQNNKFAYMVSYPDPHQPWEVREPFNSIYPESEMTVPESFLHHDYPVNTWHDSILQKQFKNINPDRIRKIKAMYSGSIHLIDNNAGKLIDELKKLDLFDNTLIIFTSDHGEYMGEHGLLYKNQFFETAYRLPFIMHIPDGPKDMINNQVFSMVDFMPGVLNIMGIEPDEGVQGSDFSLMMRSPDIWQNEANVHHANHEGAGIFTKEYYLVLHRSGEHLLYDRLNDPGEMVNLYYNKKYYETVNELTAKVISHHEKFETPEYKWISKLVD